MDVIPAAKYEAGNRCSFTVWAPEAESVQLRLKTSGRNRNIPLEKAEMGYWHKDVDDVAPGSLYFYRLNDAIRRADPASYFQPEGVHGPSAVVDHRFPWKDSGRQPIPLDKMIIYELHVGTFTEEGTFEAVVKRLRELRKLGVNAVELMPVAQFPGERNWGYDGVFPYAVQNSYGGPTGLKKLVNACHQNGFAVILDVVYNHLGPEGNYLRDFGPYFTDKYKTPWGQAVNLDGPCSDQVRDFFFQNALYWFRQYHIDALRLDALHAVFDAGARHFVQELTERVGQFSKDSGRPYYLIGESDLNDVRLITPRSRGGYGLDAQWCDDFHHSVHALITGERTGYYQDFGSIEDLAKAFREGFVYSWNYSKYRKRHHGSTSRRLPAGRFVVCIQNHDQVGNRMLGDRLSKLVDFEALKLAAAAFILSPYIPMLFMGEEYAEDSPFQYFVSHTDRELVKAVRKGREAELKSFGWQGRCPDPQSVKTFENSKLRWQERSEHHHKILLDFYRALIALRKDFPSFTAKKAMTVRSLPKKRILQWRRRLDNRQIQCLMNFSRKEQDLRVYAPQKGWTKILDSSEVRWRGPGAKLPHTISGRQSVTIPASSVAVFQQRIRPTTQRASLSAATARPAHENL